MLLTLAIIVYASIVCWAFGYALVLNLRRIGKTSENYSFGFPLTCLLGFTILTVMTGYISLFMAISHPAIHLVIAGTSFLILQRLGGYRSLRKELASINCISLPIKIFGLSSLLLVVVLSSWEVYHPDSMGYHIQIIKWLNEFEVVPGIVHLNKRFGLQSSWFVGCSLFSFSFTGLKSVTFINSALLFWLILFISDCLHSLLLKKNYTRYLLLVFMLMLVYWTFSQFRLTAMSPSPDFPTALIVWAVFYLFISNYTLQKTLDFTYTCLLFLLISFSITMKLSAVPLVILGIFLFFQSLQQRRFRLASYLAIMTVIVVLPFSLRNLISSGYLFYPSPILNLFSVDWKLDLQTVTEQVQYINAYAKTAGAFDGRTAGEIVNFPLHEWIPEWWKFTHLSDKIVLLFVLLSFLFGLAKIRKIANSILPIWVSLVTAVVGVVFWFVLAPDPRFGWSFLMPIPLLIATSAFPSIRFNWIQPAHAKVFLLLLIAITVSYSTYRFTHFFTGRQFLIPLGAKQTPFTKINCEAQTFSLPNSEYECGDLDLPCSEDSCNRIEFRGSLITNGFKARSSP